jgi:hypothetical protein
MILSDKDQEIFLEELKKILAEINFGHIFCNFIISDGCLMYIDFKRETNERVYIHGESNNELEG